MAKKLITLTEEDKEQLRKGNAAVKASTVGGVGTLVPTLPKVTTPTATPQAQPKKELGLNKTYSAMDISKGMNRVLQLGMARIDSQFDSGASLAKQLYAKATDNDALYITEAQKQKQNAQNYQDRVQEIDAKYGTPQTLVGQWTSDLGTNIIAQLPTMPLYAAGGLASFLKAAPTAAKVIGALGQVGATGMNFSGAGGMAQGRSLLEGATPDESLAYGTGSGALEAGTELIGGGIPGQKALVKAGKTLAGKALGAVLEGGEEAVVTMADPYLQRATYNPNAENASLRDVLYDASLGFGSSVVMQGAASIPELAAKLDHDTVVSNQNQRADNALFGDTSKIQEISAQNLQKNAQKKDDAPQTAENAPESTKGTPTTENPQYIENIAQNQTSKADFQQNPVENIQNAEIKPTLAKPLQTLAPEERNMQNVASRKVKAMQQEDPTLKPYIQQMAQQLLDELNTGVPGGVEVGIDPETRNVTTKRGHKSTDSEIIAEMKKAGMKTGEIRKGLELLIQDGGVENVATAKRAEMFAYKALTEGYNSIASGRVNPNYEFAYRNMTDEDLTAEEGRINDSFTNPDDVTGNKELIARLETIENMRAKRQPQQTEQQTEQVSEVSEQVSEQVNEEVKTESKELKLEDFDASQLEEDVYNFFNEIGDKFGMTVRLVKGMNKKAAGMYKDGMVYLNADRMTDIDTIRYTTVHEFLHSIKGTREYEEFQEIALRYLRSLTGRSDVTDMDLVNYIVEKRAEDGIEITSEEEAYDELTALFAEMVFDDPATINEISVKQPKLAQRVLDYIKGKIKDLKAKKGMSKIEKQQYDMLQKARKLYVKGLRSKQTMRELDADLMSSGTVVDENGNVIAEQEDGEVRFNIYSFDNGGRDTLHKFLNKMTARDMLSEEDAQDIAEELDYIHEQVKDLTQGENAEQYRYFTAWSKAKPMLDADGNPVLSVVTKNGDYHMNLDSSTRCTKRVPIDSLLNYLATNSKFDISKLKPTDFAKINEILADNGFTTACKLCYVEARRDRSAQWASDIAYEYNALLEAANIQNGVADEQALRAKAKEINNQRGKKDSGTVLDNYVKFILESPDKARPIEASELMHSEGMARIKAEMPEIYSVASRRMGNITPKPLMPEAIYTNDLITDTKSKDTKSNPMTWSPEAAFDVGGVRIQSFSDYRDNMFFDYCQKFAELASRKLPAHGYAKVENFIRLFGMTGAKLNMSLIPEGVGLDENGNYIWDAESFDFDTAMNIQRDERYSNNVGTTAVGVTDAHIWKMMDDKDIRMIIPYHSSGINPDVAKMKHIDTYTDYTYFQETKRAKDKAVKKDGESWSEYYSRLGTLGKSLSNVSKDEFNFDFYGDLMETFDPVETSKNYIEACQKADVVPKFPQFIYKPDGTFNENYYKVLTDFTLYNEKGKFCPQKAVKFGNKSLPEEWLDIVTSGLQTQQETQDRLDAEIANVAEQVIQAISGERYSTGLDHKQVAEDLKNLDKKYMDAVNSGDMETAQRMVNEAAERAGYSDDTSWRMSHSAPNSKDGFSVSLKELKNTDLVPEDFFEHPDWYTNSPEERESFYSVKRAVEMQERIDSKDKPSTVKDGYITVYRAVDKEKNAKEESFRNGDWVTPSKAYAENEGRMNPNGYRIISKKVKIKDLYWDGNSIAELGYDDGQNYAYADTKNNRKLLDAVTYDDDGNVIPLSKRFKSRKDDVRYSTGSSRYKERAEEIKNIKHSTKMSDFYTNTVKNSDLFTQAEKNLILSTVATEQDIVTEKESLQQAAESIARDHDGTKVRLLGDGLRDGVDVDMAMYFLQESADEARSKGDYTEFKRWVKRIQSDTTDSARLLQSLDKYSRTTPEGIVMQAQRYVKKTEEAMSVNKIGKTKFTPGKEFDSGKMRRIKNETKQVQDAIRDSEQIACKTAKNALRRAKKDLDINLWEVIKKGAGDKEAIANSISEHIIKNSTLEKAEAEKLAQETVDLYYKELSRVAEEKLNKMFKEQPKAKLDNKKKESWFDEVMGLINMGAYDNEDIVDAIKQKNGLPVLTAQDIETIYSNVEKANQYKRNSYEWRMYMAKAQQVAINKMPESQKKKLTQFKRLMMLSNISTHTKNFGGNTLLPGAEAASNIGAVPVDIVASKVRGSQRTTHINPQLGAYAKGFARGMGETIKDIKNGVNTYRMGDEITTQYEMPKGDTFKNPWLHGIEQAINYGLMFGDRPFFEAAYSKRLAELEKLNYDMSSELTKSEAYEYALSMVYQNDSDMSKSAKGIQEALNNFLSIGGFHLGDWVLPFTQTPANIADKLLDYTPVGLGKAIAQIARSETQPFDQRLFSQRIGRSLTGTTIVILGWALANAGIITGSGDDDYELRNAKTKAGWKEYSIKLGDTYYDYSWAQPIAMLMAIGADMYYEGQKVEDLNDFFDVAYAGIRGGANCFFNMSFLQSIFDFFGGYSTNFDNIAAGLTSFPTQLAPALGNAVNKTIDPYQRETYDPNPLKQNANKIMARLPGASQLLPVKLDAYGEPMMQNQGRNAFSRTMENVISPVKMAQENPHLVNDELLRLHETTGAKSQFLSNPDKTQDFGDGGEVELSTREYQQFQTICNKYATAQMQKLITSDAYKGMDDSTRVKVLANIEKYAKYKARKQVATAHNIEFSDSEFEKVANSGVEAWQYYATKTRFDGKWSDYDDAQKYVWTAERIGMSDADFVKHYNAMSSIKGDGQKEKRKNYLYNQWADGKITQEQYWYLRMEFAGQPSKADIAQCPYDWIITSTTK